MIYEAINYVIEQTVLSAEEIFWAIEGPLLVALIILVAKDVTNPPEGKP